MQHTLHCPPFQLYSQSLSKIIAEKLSLDAAHSLRHVFAIQGKFCRPCWQEASTVSIPSCSIFFPTLGKMPEKHKKRWGQASLATHWNVLLYKVPSQTLLRLPEQKGEGNRRGKSFICKSQGGKEARTSPACTAKSQAKKSELNGVPSQPLAAQKARRISASMPNGLENSFQLLS